MLPISAAETLGSSLKATRKLRKLSQKKIAELSGLDLETVKSLEHGRGIVSSLATAMSALEIRISNQPADMEIGPWLASKRKLAKLSQQQVATAIGVSKPTVVGLEHGRGRISSFLLFIDCLGLLPTLSRNDEPEPRAKLLHGDCLELMPSLATGSVDAIIADLPYDLTALAWDKIIPMETLWVQFRRLLKPRGVIVLTGRQPFTSMLVLSNPEWFKYCLVWEKSRKTGFQHSKQKPLKSHEDIIIFSDGTTVGNHKSKRQMTYNPQGLVELKVPISSREPAKGRIMRKEGHHFGGRGFGPSTQTHTNFPTSILKFASHASRKGEPSHATQKPVELMRYLVRTYSNAGDTILDCTMGSGTTGVASLLEGRKFIGIEKNEEFFELAKRRLSTTQPIF